MEKLNCKIGKRYKKKREPFSGRKFWAGACPWSLVGWSKTLSHGLRILLVLAIVVGAIYTTGYWHAWQKKPVLVKYKDFTAYVTDEHGIKHVIKCRDRQLYLDDIRINAKNVKALRPYGIHLKPKLFIGLGSAFTPEVGIGMEIAHFWKLNLDVFGTMKAAYIGVSYDLEIGDNEWLSNSSVGLALGRGWTLEDDVRFLFYWAIKF